MDCTTHLLNNWCLNCKPLLSVPNTFCFLFNAGKPSLVIYMNSHARIDEHHLANLPGHIHRVVVIFVEETQRVEPQL